MKKPTAVGKQSYEDQHPLTVTPFIVIPLLFGVVMIFSCWAIGPKDERQKEFMAKCVQRQDAGRCNEIFQWTDAGWTDRSVASR